METEKFVSFEADIYATQPDDSAADADHPRMEPKPPSAEPASLAGGKTDGWQDNEDDLGTIFSQEEYNQERFEEIKARTMFQMVEDVNDGKQKLLFLTNMQADLIAGNSASVEKLIAALELDVKPKLLIQVAYDINTKSFCCSLTDPENWTAPYGTTMNRGPFATLDEEWDAEAKVDAFMLEVLIPLAVQTNALVVCSAVRECQLSASLMRMYEVLSAKYSPGPPPFSILAACGAICQMYKTKETGKHWQQVKKESRAWMKRHQKLVQLAETYSYKGQAGMDAVDLSPNAPYLLVVDTINAKRDVLGDKAPFARLMTAILQYLSKSLPSICLKSFGSTHTTIEAGGLAEVTLLRQIDTINVGTPVVFLDVRQREVPLDVVRQTDRQELIEACKELYRKNCHRLQSAGVCDSLDVCAIAYFYDVCFGDADPATMTSSLSTDARPTPIHEQIKMLEQHHRRGDVSFLPNGDKGHELPGATTDQINEVASWLTHETFRNFWYHMPDAEERERSGITYQDFYGEEYKCFELCIKFLLSHPSFHGVNIANLNGIKKLLNTLVKLDRLPTQNSLEATKLLQQAWNEYDIALHLASWYKRMSRFNYWLYLLIGICIVSLTTLNGTFLQSNAELARNVQHSMFGLTLFSSFILTIGAYYNPTKRGRQLRASASTLKSIIWRFRTRTGEFIQASQNPKAADYALYNALSEWRRELIAGTDLISTSLKREYGAEIYKHLQHDGELEGVDQLIQETHKMRELDELGNKIAILNRTSKAASRRVSALGMGIVNGSMSRGSAKVADEGSATEMAREGGAAPMAPIADGRGALVGDHGQTSMRRGSVGAEDTKRELNELEKRYAKMTAELKELKMRSIDDHQSPVRPIQYVELRLEVERKFYQVRIPRCYKWMSFWQFVLATLSVASAALTYTESLSQYVAITSALAAAITSWGAYDDLGRRIERYTNAVLAINDLISWWDSLDDVDKASVENITRLIEQGESIINTERLTWLMAAKEDKNQQQKGNDGEDQAIKNS